MTVLNLADLLIREDINCRKTDREAEIAALAASISVHGLLQPILVRQREDGMAEVIDGNRRVAAIRMLAENGEVFPIDVTLTNATDDEARELSLVANIQREDIHPIDEYEAFATLSSTLSVKEIADRFGKTEKEVKQRLALGKLHPEIRAAWRDGSLRDGSAEAFTLAPDQETQKAVFDKLSKRGAIYPHDVRATLGVEHDVGRAIKAVGIDAYRAAGGTVIEDLFDDDIVVSDPDLAKRLLADKLTTICNDLVADGWSFASFKDEVKNPWNWPSITPKAGRKPTDDEKAELASIKERLEASEKEMEDDPLGELSDDQETERARLESREHLIEEAIKLRRWKPAEKKRAGCFVSVSHDGVINIDYGRVDPKAAKAAQAGEKAPAGRPEEDGKRDAPVEQPAKISAALELALSEQLTKAAYLSLRADTDLSLRVAIAALESIDSPAKIRTNGAPGFGEHRAPGRFAEVLAEDISVKDQIDRFSEHVAASLDLRENLGRPRSDAANALLRTLSQSMLEAACREAFDVEHYFKSVNAALCHAALDEIGIDKKGRPSKKADLADLAAKKAFERGWLPIQLRPWESSNV